MLSLRLCLNKDQRVKRRANFVWHDITQTDSWVADFCALTQFVGGRRSGTTLKNISETSTYIIHSRCGLDLSRSRSIFDPNFRNYAERFAEKIRRDSYQVFAVLLTQKTTSTTSFASSLTKSHQTKIIHPPPKIVF
jgi:hypothetical protein